MVGHKAQSIEQKPRTEDIQLKDDFDFKMMLLPEPIEDGLTKSGYVKPSPIQRKALPLVRCGLDLIVQAKAGTGKTCVFVVATLELVQPELPHLQAVILAPTREIAIQIYDVFKAMGQSVTGLKTCYFIGGYPLSVDKRNAAGCHIAIGSPGRVRHLIAEGFLNPNHARLFVLDEADKLVEEFSYDINEIYSQLPESKQMLATSATYTEQMVDFLRNYMHEGQYVTPVAPTDSTLLVGIRQFVSVLPLHVDRLATLRLKERHLIYLLKSVSFNQCIIFSNLRSRAESLCNMLRHEGWPTEWISGVQKQEDRVIALAQLKKEKVRLLVTTDLISRGIDVENVNLIINLDSPRDYQTYLHRMGRAGRYGSHGIVITILCEGEEIGVFQKLLGAIGGASQSVNCVPEDLRNIDLWNLKDDKLNKVFGIVKNTKSSLNLLEDSQGNIENGRQSADINHITSVQNEKPTFQKNTENGETFSKNVSETQISQSVDQNSFQESTETDEKYSQESTENENSSKESKKTDKKVYQETSNKFVSAAINKKIELNSSLDCACSFNGPVICGLEPSDIKLVHRHSLFSVDNKKKHWREVLPVIVRESQIPINTPIRFVDTKVIRVNSYCNNINSDTNIVRCSKNPVNISHVDGMSEVQPFKTVDEITNSLENGPVLELKPEKESVENDEFLNVEEIDFPPENGMAKSEDNPLNLIEIDKILLNYQNSQTKLEEILSNFNSFDVVGWMAVDDKHNIVDDIVNNKLSCIYQLATVKCSSGEKHIQIISSFSDKLVGGFEEHISALNLKYYDFVELFPLGLKTENHHIQSKKTPEISGIAESTKNVLPIPQMPNCNIPYSIYNSKKSQKCKTELSGKLRTRYRIDRAVESSSDSSSESSSLSDASPCKSINDMSSTESFVDMTQNKKKQQGHHAYEEHKLTGNSTESDKLQSNICNGVSKSSSSSESLHTLPRKPLNKNANDYFPSASNTKQRLCNNERNMSYRHPSTNEEGVSLKSKYKSKISSLPTHNSSDCDSDISKDSNGVCVPTLHNYRHKDINYVPIRNSKLDYYTFPGSERTQTHRSSKKNYPVKPKSFSDHNTCPTRISTNRQPHLSNQETLHRHKKKGNKSETSRNSHQQEPVYVEDNIGHSFTNRLTSRNLFYEWYSTWYARVRQRASQLEYIEYINTMSSQQ